MDPLRQQQQQHNGHSRGLEPQSTEYRRIREQARAIGALGQSIEHSTNVLATVDRQQWALTAASNAYRMKESLQDFLQEIEQYTSEVGRSRERTLAPEVREREFQPAR